MQLIVCSASEFKAVKTLILKPHLIPLIPAKFLAQSGKIDLKVIPCTECNSAVSEQCLRHSHRGPGTEGDPVGMVRAGLQWQHWCVHPIHLPPTETWTPYPFRSLPVFGELGLMTSLKDSIWKWEFLYLENLFEFLYLFHLHNTSERSCRGLGWGRSQTSFIPNRGCQSIFKFTKQIRTEKISRRLHRPCLGWG